MTTSEQAYLRLHGDDEPLLMYSKPWEAVVEYWAGLLAHADGR